MIRHPALTAILAATLIGTTSGLADRAARAQSDTPPGTPAGTPAATPAPATAASGSILTYSQALTPDAIRLIQARLREAGAFQGAVDGIWNSDSDQALRSYQQSRGLQVTGQITQATAVTLGLTPVELVGAGNTVPPAAPSAASPAVATRRGPVLLSREALRQVQIRLREGGYLNGAADGIWGAASRAALVRLQQTRGLPPTGRIDAATVQALGFDPNTFPQP